ncbi:MAG: class I SAM-dependent methyltransferase [Bryobacterales bacterium]|nr:class I SAM-dependent methyltransferase [Bryobacterales bacterium]
MWKVAEQVPLLNQVRNTAIDIGSGEGHLCAELAGRGWSSVAGFDISRSRVSRARRLYPHLQFYDVPLSASGIATGSVDLVVMEAVIEHLPAPLAFLCEIMPYLAPGGVLLLTTPNMDSGHFRLLGRRWTGMLAPHAHIFLFSPRSITLLFKRTGLTNVQTGSYHTPMYTPTQYLKRLAHGDVTGTLWRAHQEVGGIYGRLINRGPMLYAVGQKPL